MPKPPPPTTPTALSASPTLPPLSSPPSPSLPPAPTLRPLLSAIVLTWAPLVKKYLEASNACPNPIRPHHHALYAVTTLTLTAFTPLPLSHLTLDGL